jgi:tRNA threonylcarbamoyladenosine biosynthesis protein TsaE
MKYVRFDYGEKELTAVAARLLAVFNDERIFAFFAPMGAGKTTLIKELCRMLGVKDTVVSPTFAIVNEYAANSPDGDFDVSIENNMSVYHFDLYRLKNASEAYDVGFREIVLSGSYCFIEWAEVMGESFPSGYVRVEISVDEKTGLRTLIARKI